MAIGKTRTNGDIYSAVKELTRVTKNCNSTDSLEELLEQILESLKKQDELTKIKFCEEGIVTGYIIKVWDEETNTFGPDIFLDATGIVTTVAPTGTICSGQEVCDDKGSVGTVMDWSIIK